MHACHSVLCITPPHILEQIVRNGSSEQRNLAQQTLTATTELRRKRITVGATMRKALQMSLPTEEATGKQRTIYDAQYGSQLPGVKIRGEGDPATSDSAVNEAYDGSGFTYDLFFNIYGRNSIDNHGLKLNSTVHYQKGYDNAFWDGEQMVYGDGDEDLSPEQQLFNRFTKSLDVIGHELTHGVTQFEANLDYFRQPGALNESMSDVFGSLVRQYQRQQTADQADWIIGADLFTTNVNGVGIRSMKAPGTAYDDPVLGKDPQPAHMKDYVNTIDDNGGVHINSGIPNHAFYVVAREIGGYAWEKAGLIWYKTLTDKLTTTSAFIDAANLTYQTAGEIFGTGSLEQQAVQTGWAEVGITIGSAPTNNEGCFTSIMRALGLS